MKTILWALVLGTASAKAIDRRLAQDESYPVSDPSDDWHPRTKDPHFFQILVDDWCSNQSTTPPPRKRQDPAYPTDPTPTDSAPTDPAYPTDPTPTDAPTGSCPLSNYALRLEKGIAIIEPYNKWWDPPIPTFFVDDDTQLYTVSREPLQMYIDSSTGELRYTKVGWLPPNAISIGFFHTGNNPLQKIHPASAYLTWPSTPGISLYDGQWLICKMGTTGQYQVFVNSGNFPNQGIGGSDCETTLLGAINANPWTQNDHESDEGYWSNDDGKI